VSIGGAIAAGACGSCVDASAGARSRTAPILGHGDDGPGLGADHGARGAIVTDHGGRTSHAARQFARWVTAIVGTATRHDVLKDGQEITSRAPRG